MTRSILGVATVAVAASALTLATPLAAMASAATPTVVRPMTGEGCNYPLIGFVNECTEVVGTGLDVTSISGEFNNTADAAQTIYINYYGPNGHITNTADITVPAMGSTGWHTWHNPHPTTPMTPGYYCTEAYLSDGSPIISDCIDVRA